MRLIMACVVGVIGLSCLPGEAVANTVTSSIAEFGEPLYKDKFDHFAYADPNAPKGGDVVLGAYGSFDSLNTYILRGELPDGINMIDDALMVGSGDELSVGYGLIAANVEYPDDKSYAIFTLRPEARFQDGMPVVAEDFKAAFDAIRQHGKPFLRSYFETVDSVQILDPHKIRFNFKTKGTMKPILVVATSLAPLPRQFWAKHDITKTTLEKVIGSGPYRISDIQPGHSITYERVKDYWAKDLPVMKGQANFDHVRYDFYGDETVMFEAFKAHKIDFRQENKASRWTTQYDFPQLASGEVIKRAVPEDVPQGMQGLFFNLRRPQFQDIRVREGLVDLFDFETTQRTLLNGQYKRENNYFLSSDYSSSGLPSPAELAVLTPFKDQLAPQVLTLAFQPPKTDGTGNIRENLRAALALFKAAGWEIKDGHLTKDGQVFHFEILLDQEAFVRIMQPYVDNLKKAGIDASLRVVDTSQYQERLQGFDFDAIELKAGFFPPPGPELKSYYGSEAADVKGSFNWSGIKNPVIDQLIAQIAAARDLPTLQTASRVLDRVLLWQYYCVPQWYNDEAWITYWNRFSHPDKKPRYAIGFVDTWFVKQ